MGPVKAQTGRGDSSGLGRQDKRGAGIEFSDATPGAIWPMNSL